MTKSEQIRLTHWRFKVLQQASEGALHAAFTPPGLEFTRAWHSSERALTARLTQTRP
jgi:hypothetical protein